MNKKKIGRIIEFLLIILCIMSLAFLVIQTYQKKEEMESRVTEISSRWQKNRGKSARNDYEL